MTSDDLSMPEDAQRWPSDDLEGGSITCMITVSGPGDQPLTDRTCVGCGPDL